MNIHRFFAFALFVFSFPFTSMRAQTLSGALTSDTTLDAASSPWEITGNVTIQNNATLTIEAGCTVYVDNRVGIIVNSNGRLVAIGSENNRITMTRKPNSSDKWNGIIFENSKLANQLGFVDMMYGDARSHIIDVDHSSVVIDDMTWNTHDKTVVEVDHPSLIIQNCTFPSVGEVEVVHGNYLSGDDYLIVIGNTFGPPLGYNDVIDFTDCKRPGPIFEVYNNIFLGGGDDGLDLDGTDSHVEGNIFMNFHKGHTGSSTSNAIATGRRNGKTSDIVVARNVFFNNDHAVLLKEDCYMIAENNTFIGSDSAAVNFSEWPDRTVDPGKGARFSGNIFWNNRHVFENQFAQPGKTDPEISIDYCLVDSQFHALGEHNIDADPQFVNPDSDYHLLATSPAIGSGPNGLDMGAYVPSGASISGEPPDSTTERSATLTIGGPGIVSYRYVVNDPNATWSEERTLRDAPTITLTDLAPGSSYRVYVQGRTFAGHWQSTPEYSVSKMWTVANPAASVAANSSAAPKKYRLYENYPNPFNSSTIVRFDLPEQQHVQLTVFNALGQKMRTIINEEMNAGRRQAKINANDWSSGVYYYQLKTADFEATKRFLLVR